MSSIWITGADGFVGTWMRRALDRAGHDWAALVLPSSLDKFENHPAIGLDLADLAAREVDDDGIDWSILPPPSGLIHLAAMSFAPECEQMPDMARAVNVVGPSRMYQSILKQWPDCPILHISSGQVYRPSPDPIPEEQPLEPVNVYGSTKLEAEAVALGLRDRGHRVSVLRPFNHTGPGQASIYALPSFALRLAALEAAGGGVLEVGRLDAVRDFLHVREVVNCYLQLLESAGEVDILNVCSGHGLEMSRLLASLQQHFSTSITLVQDENRLRGAADANHLVGDPRRLEKILGHKPELDLAELSRELVADARLRVADGEDLSRA
jgi:GDP-4-dehydro-6-deoxy-D-mannose reductase